MSYTDERKVMAEISRVLCPGAKVELCVHGLGYYVNYSGINGISGICAMTRIMSVIQNVLDVASTKMMVRGD